MGTENIKNYIKLEDCKDGYLYIISARNANIGIFNKTNNSFIISRHKFKDNFIFEEYHWDTGEPYGTVKPLKELYKTESQELEYLNLKSEEYYEEYKRLCIQTGNI